MVQRRRRGPLQAVGRFGRGLGRLLHRFGHARREVALANVNAGLMLIMAITSIDVAWPRSAAFEKCCAASFSSLAMPRPLT